MKTIKLSIITVVLFTIFFSCKDNIYNNWTESETIILPPDEEEVPMEVLPNASIGSTGWVKYVDIYGDTIEYKTVRAADGRIWLQQNLGSPVVANSFNDENAYGGYFQWGRPMDMHELSGSEVAKVTEPYTPSTIVPNLEGKFIATVSSSARQAWWANGEIDDTWTAKNQDEVTIKNGQDPCKIFGEEWRLPTYLEWMELIDREQISNRVSAFNSSLKLVAGGHRNGLNGNFYQVGNIGYYWSSTPAISTDPNMDTEGFARGRSAWFWESQTTPYRRERRSNGYGVRCLRENGKTLNPVTVPGNIIQHSPAVTKIYLTAPNIEVMSNGDYIATMDFSGPNGSEAREGGNAITKIYKSSDRGTTWEYLTYFQMHMGTLFKYNNDLYMIGINPTDVIIRKSTDNGVNWSAPTTLFTGNYHSASTPVLVANGRIWKAVEFDAGGPWGENFESLMISAPVESDLMIASNWTASNRMSYNTSYLGGSFGGWLEGNAVLNKDGEVVNVLRVHTTSKTEEYVAIQNISSDGTTLTFNQNSGFHPFPGGSKKFFIRYDESVNKYITLANFVPEKYRNLEELHTMRNTLALCSSADLINWNVDHIVLETPNYIKEGFQYVTWQFNGNDIVATSRTAYEDPYSGAANYHDANYITFHRIENYKSLIK